MRPDTDAEASAFASAYTPAGGVHLHHPDPKDVFLGSVGSHARWKGNAKVILERVRAQSALGRKTDSDSTPPSDQALFLAVRREMRPNWWVVGISGGAGTVIGTLGGAAAGNVIPIVGPAWGAAAGGTGLGGASAAAAHTLTNKPRNFVDQETIKKEVLLKLDPVPTYRVRRRRLKAPYRTVYEHYWVEVPMQVFRSQAEVVGWLGSNKTAISVFRLAHSHDGKTSLHDD